MVPLSVLRELYEYNYWARDMQLKACAALSPEQLLRPMGNSFSSLRDTLAHLVAAEWVWSDRWRGVHPRTISEAEAYYKNVLKSLSPESLPTVAAVEKRWGEIEHAVRQYLAVLQEDALAQPLSYINFKGETWTYPLWRTLLHIVNHQTYHRGQVTTLLRQLGATAPGIDFLAAHDVRFQQ